MTAVAGNFTGPMVDRRKLLIGLLFCSAAGLAAWRKPTRRLDYLGHQKLEDLVPKVIGPWKFVAASGLVVPPSDQLSQATYSQLLTRVYSDGASAPIMLLMAQSGSQTGFLQIHRPETCYTASGYQITPVAHHPIALGFGVLPTNSMDATSDGLTEHVVFWTRVGDQLPESWKDQKLAVAEQNLRGIIPDAILVRVSTVRDDTEGARETLDAFVRALFEKIPPAQRSVFIA